MALPFTIFCGSSTRKDDPTKGVIRESELPRLRRLSSSLLTLLNSCVSDDDSSRSSLESEEEGYSMYSSYSSYSKQFPDEDEAELFNPSKLSFHLSPPTCYSNGSKADQCAPESPLFLWAKTDEAPSSLKEQTPSDYGFFVDLHDSFDPRLYLRQDADANDYALPPGQEVSKIIIRSRLLKIKEES